MTVFDKNTFHFLCKVRRFYLSHIDHYFLLNILYSNMIQLVVVNYVSISYMTILLQSSENNMFQTFLNLDIVHACLMYKRDISIHIIKIIIWFCVFYFLNFWNSKYSYNIGIHMNIMYFFSLYFRRSKWTARRRRPKCKCLKSRF